MATYFIILGLFVIFGCVKATSDADRTYELMTNILKASQDRIESKSMINFGALDTEAYSGMGNQGSNLRSLGYSTASQWVVLEFYTSSSCAAGTQFSGTAVGIGQCYPIAGSTAYAKLTISGSSVVTTTYSDSLCTQNPSGITSQIPTGFCASSTIDGVSSGSAQYSTSSTTPPTFGTANGYLNTYYDSAADCTAGSGAIVGYSVSATTSSGCMIGSSGSSYSTSITCSGGTNTISYYSTSPNCQGTPTYSYSSPSNSGCNFNSSFISQGDQYLYGYPRVGCYTPPQAASTGGSSSSSCFAGSETVQLESGLVAPISDVKVGDRVLAYSSATHTTVYSDVVAVPHRKNNAEASFQHIVMECGTDIKMTADHLLPAGVCSQQQQQRSTELLPLSRAADVRVGDCVLTTLGQSRVVSNEVIATTDGIYTIVTKEALLVVNGVVASPFAVNHAVADMFYGFHRVFYKVAPKLVVSLSAAMSHLAAYFSK